VLRYTQDPSLPNGVGSLGLEGEYQRELVENVNAGIKYDYNVNRGLPSSVWVSTSADIDDGTRLSAKAEYDVNSKATNIEARLERGDDAVSIDFDTGSNEAGPLKIRKTLDLNGRRLTLKPNFNVRDRTGELIINTEVDEDRTTAELTLNQADESASLEVSHRLDDYNIISVSRLLCHRIAAHMRLPVGARFVANNMCMRVDTFCRNRCAFVLLASKRSHTACRCTCKNALAGTL
jgi:hypothetical protein